KLKNAPESDSAANIVTSYPDQSAPVQSLSALNGKASNGTWKLRVKDLAAADTGTVNSFSITIGYAGETAVKSVQSTSTGYTITGLADGSYVVRAAMTGKTFTPASYPVTLGPSVSGKNFSTTGGGTTAALSNLTFNPPSVVGGNPSTGTVTLTSAAPTGGASVSLTSSSTAITVPASVTVPAGATTATFTANTIRVTADVTRSVSATYLGVTKSANLTVIASAGVSNLTASPSTAYGGDKLVGTVTLTAAAPAGGANVTLRSGSSILLVPGSVMVSAGSTSAAFTIDTLHVYATYTRYIYADYAGTTKAVAITLSSGPALYSFTANPATVKGGSSTTGAIRLNAVAPAGGIKVYLQSGSSALIVPEFVTIPAGQSVVLFTIRTTAVSATVDRAIYARRGGISKTLVVRLNP
ncbi:MAG TPA: proprotein convertase P-domain-containing protein, partial [Fimbriimonadaceae bacterium]|nr:proprotein convertase P-domain-containing protein [Fimbriimonadaceae bacterium]